MPVGDPRCISDVLDVLTQCQPERILGVGVGFGKWGVLCREVLDVTEGRYTPDTWRVKIDGIEIFPAYRNPLWSFAYDEVRIADARKVDIGAYDVILACDVLEHMEKAEGAMLLNRLLSRAKVVIVTSPRGYLPQGEHFGNVHEIHRSGWDRADFAGIPHHYKDYDYTFLAILAAEPETLQSIRLSRPLDALGLKRALAEVGRLAVRRVRSRWMRVRGKF